MARIFQKKTEDFVCEHCGAEVRGSGYTNHCPDCLWSKHVDINPGDRLSECGGLMRPDRIESKGRDNVLIHKCLACGFEKKNKISINDNFEELVKLAQEYVKK